MSLEKYVRGKVKNYCGGSFYLVERKLSELDSGGIGDFIRANRDYLLMKNIRRKFPELGNIPKQDMLFWDMETAGLTMDDPIISIAMAHLHRGADPTLQCLFARNPSEERPLLSYFLNTLPSYEVFLTYNGKSFDAPRARERAIHNGLFDLNLKGLRRLLNGHSGKEDHLDLFHIGRQKGRIHLNDAQLQSLEKVLFHHVRTNDIDSRDIPRVYYEYVFGRERMTKQVAADKEFWKTCLETAQPYRNPNLPEQEAEAQVREFAKSLYDKRPVSSDSGKGRGGYVDIHSPGAKIDEEERKSDMARLINHNLLDAASLVAALCYLCAPAEKVIVPEEEFRLAQETLPF